MERELGNGNVDIEYNGERYLRKMTYDLLFLNDSELAKVFCFSQESDPFLLAATKIVEK